MDTQDLITLDLDLDIGSQEGLSVDQMTRSRLQFLLGQNTAIMRQVQIADAKAGTLLAIIGVLILIATERQSQLPTPLFLGQLIFSLMIVGTCLLAILPRFPKGSGSTTDRVDEVFSWPSLQRFQTVQSEFTEFMRTSHASHLVISIAKANLAVSAVLRAKYQLIRAAFAMSFLYFCLFVVFSVLNATT